MIEARNFLADPAARRTEPRTVDMADPDALFPIGTVFTCENGHPTQRAVKAIHNWMQLDADLFEPMPGQPRLVQHAMIPQCAFCAGAWVDFKGHRIKLHADRRGWLPKDGEQDMTERKLLELGRREAAARSGDDFLAEYRGGRRNENIGAALFVIGGAGLLLLALVLFLNGAK